MSRLSDFYNQLTSHSYGSGSSPWQGWWRAYQSLFDTSHGGERYALSHVPIFGQLVKFRDDVQRWEDAYRNTGKDAQYASRLGGSSLGSGVGLNPSSSLKRMARSLSQVYDAEIEENVSSQYEQVGPNEWRRRE